MRLRTWMAAVAFLAIAFAASANVYAQGPQFLQTATGAPLGTPPFQDPSAGQGVGSQGLSALHAVSAPMPGQPGWVPTGAPGPGPGGPGMLPPGTQPWPRISPYEHAMEQHRIKDGLWYRDVTNGGRKFHARLGATLLQVRKPNRFRTLVGAPIVPVGAGGTGVASNFSAIDTSAFHEDPFGPTNGDVVTEGSINQELVGQFRDKLESTPGVRMIFGWQEPWGSGIEFNGFATPENEARYERGRGGTAIGPREDTTSITHGLPLDNGAGGVVVPYDQLFRINFSSTYFGGGVNWFTNDMWPRKEVRFRVTPGFRYLYIFEEFSFVGRDSGFDYTINEDGSITGPVTPLVPSYTTELFSSVRSNLFGPEIGIDYGFGGDTFAINGHTKVGIMVNVTEYNIGGYGVGDGFDPNFQPGLAFDGGETHTHVSPLFEQEIGLDFDVIGVIPVLKNCSWLEKAKVHVGYSVVLLWEQARPQYNIEYLGQPQVPRLRSNLATHRTQWYTHGWDFALTWTW